MDEIPIEQITETQHRVRETQTVLRAAQGEPATYHAETGEPHEAGTIMGAIAALSWALDLLDEDRSPTTKRRCTG